MHRDTTRLPANPRPASPLLAWAAVLLIAAVALGAVAFTRPAGEQAGYRQEVDLTYSAAADPAVYDGGRLRTGDPVYTRLVRRVEVQVGYRLMADQVGRSTGTIGLDARFSGSDGWQRTLRVAAPMRFAGPRAGMVAQVDLAQLQGVLRRAQERTQADGTYWVDLVPRVSLDAVVDGEQRSLAAAPTFGFRFDGGAFVPDAGRSGARGAAMTDTSSSEPRAAATISVGGRGLDVGTARVVSLALALGATLMAGFGLLRRPGAQRAVTDRAGHRAIEVDDAELLPPAVDVGSFDDLLDVAERYDRPLMHVRTRQGETYLVEDRGVRYRYGRTALLPVDEPLGAEVPGSEGEHVAEPVSEHAPGPVPAHEHDVEHVSDQEHLSGHEGASQSEPVLEPDPLGDGHVTGTAPDPLLEPMFSAELAKAQEAFAVDELLSRDLTLSDDAHVQRSVPAIEVQPSAGEPARPHRARHRRPVDLTIAERAAAAAEPAATSPVEPLPPRPAPASWAVDHERDERPDPVRAALHASAAAVPAPRRPADRRPRFRVADSQEGVEQLRSWLRT